MNDFWATVVLFAYYGLAVAIFPTMMRAIPGIPGEVVRKTRHVGVSLSIFILLELFSTWYTAVGAVLVLAVVVYVALSISRRYPKVFALISDRRDKSGDLRRQAMLALGVFAVLIAFYWGFLGSEFRYIVAIAVLAWGFGDAAAALIGKAFGVTRFSHRLIEGAKTVVGTGAMVAVTAVAVLLTLIFYSSLSWSASVIVAIVVAPVAAAAELFSWRGMDTISIPISVATATWIIVSICQYVGWI